MSLKIVYWYLRDFIYLQQQRKQIISRTFTTDDIS